MRLSILTLIVGVFVASGDLGRAADGAVGTKPIMLRPSEINNLTATPGVVTTLHFLGTHRIDRVLLGSKIVDVAPDEELSRLDIKPAKGITRGSTNMILTVDGIDFVFVVQIDRDPSRAIYTRTFTFEHAQQSELIADLQRLGGARDMRPSDIDADGLAKQIDLARKDPVYRRSMPDLRQVPIAKPYIWNDCVVHLMEVNALLDSDILVFRIQWVNTTGSAHYLSARQVNIKLNGKKVRIKASTQDVQDCVVDPGKMDTIWLVAQHESLGYVNAWEIELPIESRYVRP